MKVKYSLILLVLTFITFPSWGNDNKIDPYLQRIINAQGKYFATDHFGKTFSQSPDEIPQTLIHFFIEADLAALPALRALGVEINTITSHGIMTAMAPISQLPAIAALTEVRRLEAAHPVKLLMDQSAGPSGVNLPNLNFPRLANTGRGVVVGVIDTGIDIEHPDFIDEQGNTRVVAIWDHTLDPSDVGGIAPNPTGFTYGTQWNKTQIQGGYTTCLHRDNDGHGTHVAGTSAGNGRAPTADNTHFTGLAPEAELLMVKFDFDNEKNRNTTTALLDGINWIFQQAATLGKPAVINMSLGSDYGPHDGSMPEERGIDDLTGANKIVVVAAGNAAATYGGTAFETFGAPLHGAGNFSTRNDIVFNPPNSYLPSVSASDYIFFDVWYSGNDTSRIQITTPSGQKYPPNFNGIYKNLWKTNGTDGGFNTNEGFVYCYNFPAVIGWDTNNGDNNIYCEISDAYGVGPVNGKWVVEFIPLSGSGNYQAWHGYSDSLAQTYFWYNSGTTKHTWGNLNDPFLSDSHMTIGSPATASQVISIGAYQTKNQWNARIYHTSANGYLWDTYVNGSQAYGIFPVDYYDPFTLEDLAFFSSRGPSRDGRIQPFISAPGVGIVASLSQPALDSLSPPTNYNYYRYYNRIEPLGYYATLQGTSMACPHGTGSVALLLEEAHNKGINPTPAIIKSYLQQGARIDGFTGSVPNNDWGYGKIDVSDALTQVQAAPPPELNSCQPNSGTRNQTLMVTLTGNHFQPGATVDFGPGITVLSTTTVSPQEIVCNIKISRKIPRGERVIKAVSDVVVTNPDAQSATLVNGFTIK
ncbi:peptidase S8/S53 [Thioploca ingrica]|uniref:Peptidase S8/S53 n=1 Tax=Thioploca ingrica TaxID=40754 RepID=A0A090ADY3_9GAMM|nr:peptidase S8/S53 [Thioploca ingrica]